MASVKLSVDSSELDEALDKVTELRKILGDGARISVLELHPGDILVVRLLGRATQAQIIGMRDFVKAKFPDNEVMVMEDGADLAVLRPGSED